MNKDELMTSRSRDVEFVADVYRDDTTIGQLAHKLRLTDAEMRLAADLAVDRLLRSV